MISISELGLAGVAGSLTTLNPCVFPLLPLVLSSGAPGHRLAPLAMGAGMVASFAGLGLLVGVAPDALGLEPDRIRIIGAILLMVFGLVMLTPRLQTLFARWMTPLATSAQRATSRWRPDSLCGAFGVGGLLGMVWSPCSGPLLASALALVATEGGALRGAALLGMFGAGAATVLVAAAYASRAAFAGARVWVTAHIDALKLAFGGLMILLGLAILSGGDKWLEAQVLRLVPMGWASLTTAI